MRWGYDFPWRKRENVDMVSKIPGNGKSGQIKHLIPGEVSISKRSKTPYFTKTIRFREHIEWAEKHGQLDEIIAYWDSLSEKDWLYEAE